ncbi:MAG: hypothetical protein ACREBC_33480 [Pyrinomonadaceae bacterium]
MMKPETSRKLMTLAAVVLTLYLLPLGQSTSAQEQSTLTQELSTSAHGGCRNVKGNLREVSNGSGTTGRITQGGILNGTTELIFTSGVLATPDPTTISYTDDFTITTHRGVLKTHNVGIFDFATGLFTEIARIDSDASTGVFARATGSLFTSGKTPDGGANFRSKITGEVCLAHHGHEDDSEDAEDDR